MNHLVSELLQIRSEALYIAGLALAILVTWHVLLRKREVASAVGWIGLVWFSPLMGAAIYALFGVNRVRRRARLMRPRAGRTADGTAHPHTGGDGHLDALERGIGSITGHKLLPGNAVQIFHDGDEAYPPMLAAIGAARHSIGMSSYIFRADEWGGRFIEALAEAQRRGVAVRVLIDGIGGGWLLSPAYRRLRGKGVPAARFLHSPLPWRMPFLNLRSHKKILVVDGSIGFTGGMNVADQNVMATKPPSPVQDTHFRLVGPVVAQLTEAFVRDWGFATGEALEGGAWFPGLHAQGAKPARVIESGPDGDIEKAELAILQAIACARSEIAVMTPYFLPDERLISALSMAAMRGVAVDVMLPQTGDHPLVDWAVRANTGPMLASGVRVWRSSPPFRHTKLLIVDGEWSLIGSCNWDSRSFRLNFELCVELYGRELAQELGALMLRCRGNPLTRAELDGRTMPGKLRDAAARLLMPYL